MKINSKHLADDGPNYLSEEELKSEDKSESKKFDKDPPI